MYKKIIVFFLLILILFTVSFVLIDEALIKVLTISTENKIYFFVIYFLTTFLYFLTPLPVTIIILFNGYIFGLYGFILSLTQLTICSALLFLFSEKIYNFFQLEKYKKKIFVKINIKKFSENNYSIFLLRFLIPYFLHNIYYGISNVNFFRFISIVFISEIPMTYAINSIGNSISNLDDMNKVSFFSLLSDKNFYVPFIIIFMIFVLTNYFYKKK